MYDTINFRLRAEDCSTDFLEETPCHFEVVGTHDYRGEAVVTGRLGNLTISCTERAVSIKDGSLSKWHLGDNFQVMSRGDTRRAVEALSDTLHLPIERANVTRIDVAHTFIMKQPTANYIRDVL